MDEQLVIALGVLIAIIVLSLTHAVNLISIVTVIFEVTLRKGLKEFKSKDSNKLIKEKTF